MERSISSKCQRVESFFRDWEREGDHLLENLDEVLPELPGIRARPELKGLMEETGRLLTKRYFQANKEKKHEQVSIGPMKKQVEELKLRNGKLEEENKHLRQRISEEGDSRMQSMLEWRKDRDGLERVNEQLRVTNEQLLVNLQKTDQQMKMMTKQLKGKGADALAKTKFFEEDKNDSILMTLCYFYEQKKKISISEFEEVIKSVAREYEVNSKHIPSISIHSKTMGLNILSKIDTPEKQVRASESQAKKVDFFLGVNKKTGDCIGGFENIEDVTKIIIDTKQFIPKKTQEIFERMEPIIVNLLENYRKLNATDESIILPLPKTGREGESKALEDLVKDLHDLESVHTDSRIQNQSFSNTVKASNICSLHKSDNLFMKKAPDAQISNNFSFAYLSEASKESHKKVDFVSFKSKVEYKAGTIKEEDEFDELFSDPENSGRNTMAKSNVSKIFKLEEEVNRLKVKVKRAMSRI